MRELHCEKATGTSFCSTFWKYRILFLDILEIKLFLLRIVWQTVYCEYLDSGGRDGGEEMFWTLLKESKFLSKKLELKFVTTVRMQQPVPWTPGSATNASETHIVRPNNHFFPSVSMQME